MANWKAFAKAGHLPTLIASFLYFDFCFAIWVLNGAMAPFISEAFNLSPAQKGFMISIPIMAGALMRFPLGVMAQYIGRKNAALVEMGCILVAMLYGYYAVSTYGDVLAMGVLLGIAGASFGVALSLGSGWFPAQYKGLAMGIAGAGNSGTVLAVELHEDGVREIARRSRGTPRIANRILRRVRDYAQVRAGGVITRGVARDALQLLDVDEFGLDDMDARILKTIIEKFEGGPVGVQTIAAALGEDPDTIEEVYEPFLVQNGLLQRTARGRVASAQAYRHFGFQPPPRAQADLF